MRVALALLLVLTGCSAPATTGAPATTALTPTAPADATVTPQGFAARQARVLGAGGEVCELCVWLADTPDLRAQGLMDVTGLGAADAMAFAYPRPTTTSFWMFRTLLPLSIAFFDSDGRWLDAFDMVPCAEQPCERHPTPNGFSLAVEVPAGRLPELSIGPGSTFELLDLPCG